MLESSDVIAFVATRDAAKARAFYGMALGLPMLSEDPFALVFDAHGTMLRVTRVREVTPAAYTILGWRVSDIRRAVTDLMGRGLVFQRYEGMAQDEMGIWTAPGGAKVAWFKDPDGNTLSLTQFADSD